MMQGIPSRVLSMMVSILLAIGLFPLSALALDAHEGWEACGTCEWQVSGGHLAIRPIDGVSGTLADKMSRYRGVPWSSQAASITSASIAPGVKAGSSCCLFANMANLVDISGLSNLDVSGATSLSGMFSGCASLKEADLSSWDTSKVTTMDSMFYGMRDLRSLNLAGFNTSSVSQMGYMFAEYSAPAPLDLSSFDLSSISNMDYMFENYSSSTALNLKSLNFGPIAAKSQVWMRHFLEGYSSSAALDLSPLRFPTGSGDYTDSLFARYASSRPLDLSRLNLSGVKGVLNLFDGYSSTAPLDLSALRMPDATSANGLVCNSNILDSQLIGEETLDLSKMTNIKGLFNNLRNITSIDVSHWNTSRVVDMSGLLEGCASLKTIDLSSLDCSNVKYFGQPAGKDGSGGNSPFYNCTALESAVMPRIALSSSACLFEGCSSLKDVDLSRVDFSNARYAYKAFYGCASLRAVPSGFSFGASTSNDNCFYVDSTAPIAIEYSGSDPAILSYNWAADNRELLIVSPRISVDAPQPVSGLTYTGGTLVGVPESALYTRSGEYSATNAGSYICTVSLNDASSYRWSDGSTASKTISWSIAPAEMTEADIVLQSLTFNYTGSAITPVPEVSYGERTLVKDTDFTLSYEANKNVGTATVIVTGKGNYTGSKAVAFNIVDANEYLVGRDTWSFQNFDVGEYGIPIEYCQRLFGYSYGKTVFEEDIGNGGECYGMAAAAQSSVVCNKPPVNLYSGNGKNASNLSDVARKWKNSLNSLTAEQLVMYGQIAQRDPKMLKEQVGNAVFKSNPAKLAKLVEAVENAAIGGAPVTIMLFPGTGGGHAVWGLRVDSDTSAMTKIVIYDSNWPSEEREVRLLKDSSGSYSGWSYDFWWNETWGPDENASAWISWATPGDDLQSLLDRNGKFDKNAYERELWYNRLYDVPTGVNVVSKGASYELTSSTLLDTGELLVAPNVGMTPEGGKADSHVLCWSNLPEEVGFTNINEDSSISVASSTGGVTAQVAAGSEMIVNVSDEDSNSVEIMQPTGSSFAVEYFNESGEDITISGEGDQLVSTSQAGDNLVVSGVTSLTVAGASGAKTVSSLDSGKTYTVIVDDSGSSSKVALGDLKNASVSLTGSFTFTGKAHTPKPTVSYAGKELVENTDYKLAYASNVNAGTAKVVITGIGDYGGAQESSFTISRAANPMQAKAVAKKVSLKGAKKLKKSKAVAGAVKFTKKAIGEVTYARVSKGSSKWLSVAKSTGKVTVKKGAPKGIYKMKVNVKAAGSGNYKAATKALTVKVVVK